tara:strand:+ start:188 stop:499 length:312 start_codon:yes stop_codon:yes gene_type:complete
MDQDRGADSLHEAQLELAALGAGASVLGALSEGPDDESYGAREEEGHDRNQSEDREGREVLRRGAHAATQSGGQEARSSPGLAGRKPGGAKSSTKVPRQSEQR